MHIHVSIILMLFAITIGSVNKALQVSKAPNALASKVRLYNNGNASDKGGDFCVANSSWSESSVTWNNVPVADSIALASLGAVVAVNTWIKADVTSLITGDGTYSLRVKSISSDGADYASEETSGSAPQLVVEVENSGTIPLITDPNRVFSFPQVSKPSYLKPIKDPTFGTRVTRIAGNAGITISFPDGSTGKWGSDVRHHYSKDQPWNSNQTLIYLENRGGSPGELYLDGNTYQPKNIKCSNYSDSAYGRWNPSPNHPNERVKPGPSGNFIQWFDVVKCVQTRKFDLPFSFSSGPDGGPFNEGDMTPDGRFAAFAKDTRYIFVIDMDPQAPYAPYPNKRVGPLLDISSCGLANCSLDWVSISPSGKYVVVSYSGDYVRVYKVDPSTLALSVRAMPASSHFPGCTGTASGGFIYDLGHADMTRNPFDNNEDVLIGQEHCGNHGKTINGVTFGYVVMVRLSDGKVTSLTSPNNEEYPHHISAKNYDRPGWVYVGYNIYNTGTRFRDEIIAVKLDGSQAIERLAHTHSDQNAFYRAEPHAVPSRDGKRVIWASSWSKNCGSTCGSISNPQAYVLDTRLFLRSLVINCTPCPRVAQTAFGRCNRDLQTTYRTTHGPIPAPDCGHPHYQPRF
jgi:hypothetical protein